uniref:Peptidase S1 domain-containing protein n=1 Tax=Anopheles dirus TaxID=7168 RepID=A0A182MYN1_9DIPT
MLLSTTFVAIIITLIAPQTVAAETEVALGAICRVDGNYGRCVHYKDNPNYIMLLLKSFRTPEEQDYLLRHLCNRRKGLTCRIGSVNAEQCGIQMQDRIVGGQIAAIDQYPWMALLQYINHRKGTKRFACGGALISQRFVLSAAHCFARLSGGVELYVNAYEARLVRLGEWDTESEVDCEDEQDDQLACAAPVQDFGYDRIIVHENYTGRHNDRSNDIALIQLDRPAEYNEYVKPICLPEPGTPKKDRLYFGTMWGAGWGRTENATGSRYKMFVPLDVYDQDSCNEAYLKRHKIPITDGQFCALGAPGKDTCSGDSGGPLMKPLQAVHYVVGVVSFGPVKCGNGIAAVYTRVDKYYDWIVTQMVEFEK